MKNIMGIIFSAFILFPFSLFADFDFDDMQTVEKTEQTELLEKAKEAAQAYRFEKAEQYVEEARQKSYAPDAISDTLRSIEKHKAAYEAEQKRKRQIAERERKEKDERERAAAMARTSGGSYSSSGGSSPPYIQVQADCGYWCLDVKLNLSGGSGNFSSDNGNNGIVGILKSYSGSYSGSYHYVVTSRCRKTYSGSFRVSGNKGFVNINLSGSDAYITEH